VKYVYILESEADAAHFYVGLTDDVPKRVENHNLGRVPHTAKFRPWRLKNVIGFAAAEKAVAFEKYLKSGSGRAFARKRL
jgi:putative endonuclease